MLFKENVNKKVLAAWKNRETVEEAVARGVKIEKVEPHAKRSKKKAKTFDAQKFLDNAIKAGKESQAVAFLEAHGFEVV